MNRILNSIAKMKAQIENRIQKGLTTAQKVKETAKALDMEIDEYVKFQETKSLAVVQNVLTLDEGQTVYALLGNTVETFNKQPVEVKAVLTNLFKELLTLRITNPSKVSPH